MIEISRKCEGLTRLSWKQSKVWLTDKDILDHFIVSGGLLSRVVSSGTSGTRVGYEDGDDMMVMVRRPEVRGLGPQSGPTQQIPFLSVRRRKCAQQGRPGLARLMIRNAGSIQQ